MYIYRYIYKNIFTYIVYFITKRLIKKQILQTFIYKVNLILIIIGKYIFNRH